MSRLTDSDDPQGPQCEGYDSEKNLRCSSTTTKLYHLPGKPVHLQKRWFCQVHGTMMAPTGGGIDTVKGRQKVVSWEGSRILVEKKPQEAELKITKLPRTRNKAA